MHPKQEKTLVLIKPDGVQRSLIGEIISRVEKAGLKITALKLLIPTEEQALQHYGPTKEDITALGKRSIDSQKKNGREINETPYEQGTAIVNRLKKYLSCGPIVALVIEGAQAIQIARKLVGATEPLRSDIGTIRGDYTIDSYGMADSDDRAVRNLVHASGCTEEAEREIKVWFKDNELCKYNIIFEKILYDVNLDGIKE